MSGVKDMMAKEPVLVINAVVALATVAAAYGMDVDPAAVGSALGALLVLAGITRTNVWAPASVEAEVQDARAEVLVALDEADASAWEARKARLEAEGYNVDDLRPEG